MNEDGDLELRTSEGWKHLTTQQREEVFEATENWPDPRDRYMGFIDGMPKIRVVVNLPNVRTEAVCEGTVDNLVSAYGVALSYHTGVTLNLKPVTGSNPRTSAADVLEHMGNHKPFADSKTHGLHPDVGYGHGEFAGYGHGI